MSNSQKKLPTWWVEDTFDLLFRNVTSSTLKIQQKHYKHFGKYPVIDQGQDLIGGYTDDEMLLHPNMPPLIVFGDHTRCLKFIDFRFSQGADGVKVIEPNIFMDPKYCFWALKQTSLPDKGYSRHFKFLKNSIFPIPPFNEQKRIVARIEELQARSRRAREVLEDIPDLLDQLRQSILAVAFRGDLTKEWREKHPNVEPASDLLKRIRTERRKRWEETELEKLKAKGLSEEKLKEAFASRRRQYKEPTPLDTSDLPELPKSWCWASVGELSDSLQYGSSLKSSKDGHIPVIRMGNLQNGEIDWSDLVYTSDKAEIKKYALSPGTVLFNRTNSPELVGKTSIFRGEREAIFAGYLIRINHAPQILPQYLNLMLNAPYTRQLCTSVKSDAVSQSNINASKLASFPISLCSQEEQDVIIAMAERIISGVSNVKKWAYSLFDNLNYLDQSILSKAFRGELVPQYPNDEPASVLLERISSTKTVQPMKAKRSVTERKPQMEKMSKESLKETIRLLPEESISFEELRNMVPGDYEALKEILFALLDEAKPILKQVFDKEAKAIRFVRVKS